MKKTIAAIILIALLLTGFSVASSAAAQTEAQKSFIARVGALASADMKRSGILASLTIAQAILESGWGTSELATKANALFGIKADSRWSGKTYSKVSTEWNGTRTISVNALFRAYNSWEHSVEDHSAFLAAGTRYAAVIGERNYRKACTAVHKAGYATAPDYADRLIQLIETYGLAAYDAVSGAPSGTPSTPTASTPATSTPSAGKPATPCVTITPLTPEQKALVAALLKQLCCNK